MYINIYTYSYTHKHIHIFIYTYKTIDGKSGTDRRKKWDRLAIIDGKSGTDRRKKWDRCDLQKPHESQYWQGFADFGKNAI
jgi:hypothetical protein